MKESNQQLELFSQSSPPQDNSGTMAMRFLSFAAGYEKAIVFIISLIVTGVVCFSFGIEQGKKRIPLEEGITQASLAARSSTDQASSGVYIIQVASFKDKTFAKKEADFLSRKGYPASLWSSSGKFVLCVGNFKSEEKARAVLSKLIKVYNDSFIRRL
ncbi:MAG: SPOR domain-containing protein [Candidatus Omnitrophica bacterium]|jgi:hypothetical protein|nr:SPOR domain-containing protein [Candidatus Omnitrophota bacterium]